MKNPNKAPTNYFHQLKSTLNSYEKRSFALNTYIHLTDLQTTELIWTNKTSQLFLENLEKTLPSYDKSNLSLNKIYNSDDLRQLSLRYVDQWKKNLTNINNPIEKSYLLNKHQGDKLYVLERIVPFSRQSNKNTNAILGLTIQLNIGLKSLSPLETLIKENAQLKHQIKIAQLTPKEKEVLRFIAQGHSTLEIAAILDKSKNTIETHRKRILSKLNCKNMAQLTHFAVQSGLY